MELEQIIRFILEASVTAVLGAMMIMLFSWLVIQITGPSLSIGWGISIVLILCAAMIVLHIMGKILPEYTTYSFIFGIVTALLTAFIVFKAIQRAYRPPSKLPKGIEKG